jgi:hypothetical protein
MSSFSIIFQSNQTRKKFALIAFNVQKNCKSEAIYYNIYSSGHFVQPQDHLQHNSDIFKPITS